MLPGRQRHDRRVAGFGCEVGVGEDRLNGRCEESGIVGCWRSWRRERLLAIAAELRPHLFGGDQFLGIVIVENHADGSVPYDESQIVRANASVDGCDDEENAAGVPAIKTGGTLALFANRPRLSEELSHAGLGVLPDVRIADTDLFASQILDASEVF